MRSALDRTDRLQLLTCAMSGNFRSRFELGESGTGRPRQSGYGPDHNRNRTSLVDDSERGSDVGLFGVFHSGRRSSLYTVTLSRRAR